MQSHNPIQKETRLPATGQRSDTSSPFFKLRKRSMSSNLNSLESVHNFRDIASITNTKFGRSGLVDEYPLPEVLASRFAYYIQPGRVFRSAHVDNITLRDERVLLDAGEQGCAIKTVVDLRYNSSTELREAKKHNPRYPYKAENLHFINLTGTWFRLLLVCRLFLSLQWASLA